MANQNEILDLQTHLPLGQTTSRHVATTLAEQLGGLLHTSATLPAREAFEHALHRRNNSSTLAHELLLDLHLNSSLPLSRSYA